MPFFPLPYLPAKPDYRASRIFNIMDTSVPRTSLSAHLREIFPGVSRWFTMPGYAKWLAFSCGLIIARGFPASVLPSIYASIVPGAIVLLTAICLFLNRTWLRMLLLFTCGALLMTWHSSRQLEIFGRYYGQFANTKELYAGGRAVSSALQRSDGAFMFILRCDSLYDERGRVFMRGKNVRCITRLPPERGTYLFIAGTYVPPGKAAVPGGFDEYTYHLSQNLWGTLRAYRQVALPRKLPLPYRIASYARHNVHTVLSHLSDNDYRTLLQAAFLGEKAIPPALSKSFRDAGLTHLLAISGLHVGILSGAILFSLWPFPFSRRLKLVIIVALLYSYLLFVGFVPSLFRAVVMATLVAGSLVFQRKAHTLNTLGLAGIVWLYFSPMSIFTPGYQLSFAATAGIILLYPLAANSITFSRPVLKHTVGPLCMAGAVSLAAFIATAPVLVYHFGTLSLYGLAANVCAVLLMSLCMWFFFGAIVFQMFLPPLAALCMHAAEFPLAVLVRIAGFVSHLPFTVVDFNRPFPEWLLLYSIFFAGLAGVRKELRLNWCVVSLSLFFVMVPAILLIRHVNAPAEICVLPGKKGMHATAIRLPNARIWLAGPSALLSDTLFRERTFTPWFRYSRGRKIDALVVTSAENHGENPPRPSAFLLDARTIITPEASGSLISGYDTGIKRFEVAPQCTCFLTENQPERQLQLIFSYWGRRYLISPEDDKPIQILDSGVSADTACIHRDTMIRRIILSRFAPPRIEYGCIKRRNSKTGFPGHTGQ